jgi:putative transposase
MKNTLSHTVWECKYHVVWVPKKRRRVIYGKLRQEIVRIMKRLCEYKGIEIVEGKACLDHIHLCLSIPPKYSVAGMIGYLKGKSSMILFEQFSKLKKNFKGHHFWARGYYVSTVGLDEGKIKKYIRDQDENESIEDRWDTDLSNPFEGSA